MSDDKIASRVILFVEKELSARVAAKEIISL